MCEARPAARAALMMRLNIYFQPENEKTARVSTRELTSIDLKPSLSDYKLPLA
ncbi:hypothetical protein JMA18_19915 [Acinetobacter baumannii]|nr:hypothetical protein [Acinetobacter baumannii]